MRVVRGRGWRLPRAAARVHPDAAHGQRGGRRCGLRGASRTSNFEKSLKKNETALDFCTSVRFFGLVGLSGPMPPTVEQNVPDVKHMGASAARCTAAVRGARCVGRDGLWEGPRAPELMSPPASTLFAPPLLTFTVFIAVGTAPMFPPPLDSA